MGAPQGFHCWDMDKGGLAPAQPLCPPLKGRFLNLKAFLHAWKKLAAAETAMAAGAAGWAQLDDNGDAAIPRDVPKGHTVVYVGEELRRYVVRVSSLYHPLFRELLDRARDEYGFAAADTRLCIPYDEDMFLAVLCHVDAEREWSLALCS